MQFVTRYSKHRKYIKWYGGIVQNLETINQILAGLCTFNYVQFSIIFHLLIQKCLGGIFSGHTYIMRNSRYARKSEEQRRQKQWAIRCALFYR